MANFNSSLKRSDPGAWKFDAPCAGSSKDVSSTDSMILSVTSKPILAFAVLLL